MQNFFGTDKSAFSAFSNRTRTTRRYDRFSEALKEIIDARVWAGIHFRTADVQGRCWARRSPTGSRSTSSLWDDRDVDEVVASRAGWSATRALAVALLLGLVLAPGGRAYETPASLNEVARWYSLGVGEVRCASPAEWDADAHSRSYWGYTNIRKEYAVLAPHVCEGALNVANAEVPAWKRAVGTLVLVHEAFHLRHWRFRRDEGKVECQAIVYFTEAAQKLGASEAEANNLYPYALAWHWRRLQLLPWYRDPTCLIPPWIPPTP